MSRAGKPLVLTILDGWGVCDAVEGNAIACAAPPNYNKLWNTYPHTVLTASGEAVGLPEGQMGNSEVGHLNIGAGRVVYQELTRINLAIKNESFFQNPVLLDAINLAKEKDRGVHLMGLLSDGGVHSHIDHLFGLLDMAAQQDVKKVYLHCFLDGRDVPPSNAMEYIRKVQKKLKELGMGTVSTVMGRFYAMDRDQRWDRVEKAYQAMVYGVGVKALFPQVAVEQSYEKRVTDEFVEPTVIVDEKGQPKGLIESGDTLIFYNFRSDRAREITRAFTEHDFNFFDRGENPPQVHYVCLTQYDVRIKAPVVFPPQNLNNTLGQVLANHGLKQLRIAETEKYAHVTFFFNGGVEAPNIGEDRVLIPSPRIATYNLQPEMSAYQVTKNVIEKIESGIYDVIVLNYANTDMVGHTGIMEAAIKAVGAVDQCLGLLLQSVKEQGGSMIITADHGNAEAMIDLETGEPLTAHNTDKVPFIMVNDDLISKKLKKDGALCDIAPTMLEILGLEVPEEMMGKSLIR